MNVDLLAIVGPTAVGKSKISIDMAQRLNAEIISCDSMLVYRRCDIGTAKPQRKERAMVKHHLIDLVEPDELYNVSRYVNDSRQAIEDIQSRGKLPLLVGGTGLYLSALLENYNFPIAEPNPSFRQQLQKQARLDGTSTLHKQLKNIDPASAKRIHPNDLLRIIRALEIYEQTNQPASHHQKIDEGKTHCYNACVVGLLLEKHLLHRRIEERIKHMTDEGLIKEVEQLLKLFPPNVKPLQAIGYREFVPVVEGRKTVKEAISACCQNTKRLSKRQLTWFKNKSYITWLDVGCMSINDVATQIQSLWMEFKFAPSSPKGN